MENGVVIWSNEKISGVYLVNPTLSEKADCRVIGLYLSLGDVHP